MILEFCRVKFEVMNRRIVALGLFVLFLGISAMAQGGAFDNIALAIKTGNARELAKTFDKTVEITIYDKEQVYSKAQAELVLKDFFAKHLPSAFTLIHKGESGQTKFGIGTLVTSRGTFRTYILVKKVGSKFLIQQIRFEKN